MLPSSRATMGRRWKSTGGSVKLAAAVIGQHDAVDAPRSPSSVLITLSRELARPLRLDQPNRRR